MTLHKHGMQFIAPTRRLPGVPARDLSHTETLKFGGYKYLAESGLYLPKPKPQLSNKEMSNGNN
jgi:hypothetical protein